MNVRNLYLVMARDVTTDASDRMTSINKIIERFNFSYNPVELEKKKGTGKDAILFGIKYAIASSWHLGQKLKKETFYNFKMNVVDPNGKDLGGPTQENLFPAGIDRVNVNFLMEGLPATISGNYVLNAVIESKAGEILATNSYPFLVELTEDASIQP